MTKKCFVILGKIVYFLLAFCILFAVFQRLIILKDTIPTTDGFKKLDDNSVDVLGLGASQMFCTINAEMLTDEYHISTYDFGANSQYLTITHYYLQEALKTQHPKVVMVEVCRFFDPLSEIDDAAVGWNYISMPFTKEKYDSLNTVLNGDTLSVVKHYLPLIPFHARWYNVVPEEIKYFFHLPSIYSDYSSRGYFMHSGAREVEIEYLQNSTGGGTSLTIPPETVTAISDIVSLCEENDISVVFFKSPTASWPKANSEVVKDFMREQNLTFLEMNDYLNEIGIDAKTDFYDENHLNGEGATKATAFLADYLKTTFSKLS